MSDIQDNDSCPCCSGKQFAVCCRDIVAGTKLAQTPLELMRSRYTAHVCKNMPHILRTMSGKSLKLFDMEKTEEEWFGKCIWTKLEIIDAPEVAKNSKEGIVEFKAHYTLDGKEEVLHERSKFLKDDGKWSYVTAQKKNADIASSDKVGRNDACPCGSGKKYKKCCG